MIERSGFRYRLYPRHDQRAALVRWAGCARAVYNAALEQRRMAWRMGQRAHWAAQDAELPGLKRAFPFLQEPHSDVLQQALRDLDESYRRCFAGIAGAPKPRRKGRHDRFRVQARRGGRIDVRRLNRRWGELRLPKLGWIRFRWSRAPVGDIKHVMISRDALGWHAALCCEREIEPATHHEGPPIGLDRGVAVAVADSDGNLHQRPSLPPGEQQRLRRLERRAGRQETARRRRPNDNRRRSRRHQRTLDHIARLRAREARIRKNFLHGLSHDLAKSHGVVAIEALRVDRMTRSARGMATQGGTRVAQKRGLNRAVRAQGWGELARQLAYKTARRGGEVIAVPAPHSSQTCAECWYIDHASRVGRRFFCTACGHTDHADVNGARVILARALRAQEDGGRTWPLQHGEPSAQARRRTVNHPAALAA